MEEKKKKMVMPKNVADSVKSAMPKTEKGSILGLPINTAVRPQEKPAMPESSMSSKSSVVSTPKEDGETFWTEENKTALYRGLIPLATTLAGYAAGGYEGGAKGAEIGGKTFSDIYRQDRADKEKKAKKAEKAAGIQAEQERKKELIRFKAEQEAPAKLGKRTSDLRKERSQLPMTKDTQSIVSAYNKVQLAASEPSAAGDLSLIFNYMKMLDPGSVVREGEFATAQNAAGVPDQVRNLFNRVQNGERLNPRQRKDFVQSAGKAYQAQIDAQTRVDKQFEALAKELGVPKEQIILQFQAEEYKPQGGEQPPAPQPQPGMMDQLGGVLGTTPASAAPPRTEIRTVDGVQYKKVPGGWEEM